MIKKLLIPMLFFFTANMAFAQRFNGGALLGFNASQVEGDIYKGYNKPGLAAGFYVETDIAPAIFAAMEIKFSQKGSRKKVTTKDPTKYIMRLNYIDLPIYMAFRTSQNSAIIGGISTGFLISAKELNEDGELPPEEQHPFNTIDLQPLIGFQFDFMDNFKADLRFAYSVLPIRSILSESGSMSYWDSNQFNNVITLALYYQIGR